MAYEASARFYDLFVSENDVSYYKELGQHCGSALEAGVSTARGTLELAKAEVWGIDNSVHMLKEARKKTEKRDKGSAKTR